MTVKRLILRWVTLAVASGDTEPRTVVPPHTFAPLQLDQDGGAAWSPPSPGPLTQVTDRVLVALHRRGRPTPAARERLPV